LSWPEIGFAAVDESGEVTAEFEVVWPEQSVRILLNVPVLLPRAGWRVLTDQVVTAPESLLAQFCSEA
jgi:hypothetical protein